MSITPIAATGSINPLSGLSSTKAAESASKAGGVDFLSGLNDAAEVTKVADQLGQQLATGDLTDLHEFTAAAAKASIGIELTVAVRNQALSAYQEIMRMQV
ncbi:MAG: flagellar hook-basal body complex protein FliE [Acidimicrobiales bacterium]